MSNSWCSTGSIISCSGCSSPCYPRLLGLHFDPYCVPLPCCPDSEARLTSFCGVMWVWVNAGKFVPPSSLKSRSGGGITLDDVELVGDWSPADLQTAASSRSGAKGVCLASSNPSKCGNFFMPTRLLFCLPPLYHSQDCDDGAPQVMFTVRH